MKNAIPGVYVARQFKLWHELYGIDFESYHDNSESIAVGLWSNALSCSSQRCTSENHKEFLTNFYESIVSLLR